MPAIYEHQEVIKLAPKSGGESFNDLIKLHTSELSEDELMELFTEK